MQRSRSIAQRVDQRNHVQTKFAVGQGPFPLLLGPIGPMIPLARLIAAPADTASVSRQLPCNVVMVRRVRYATAIGYPQKPQRGRRQVSSCSVVAGARRSFLAIKPSLSTRALSHLVTACLRNVGHSLFRPIFPAQLSRGEHEGNHFPLRGELLRRQVRLHPPCWPARGHVMPSFPHWFDLTP